MTAKLPFVAAAFLCEGATEEGGVFSISRIVDTYYTDLSQAPKGKTPVLTLHGLIILKTVDEQRGEVSVRLRLPNGTAMKQTPSWNVSCKGGESGALLNLKLGVPIATVGLYWLDVLWNAQEVTAIPFRIAPPKQTAVAPEG